MVSKVSHNLQLLQILHSVERRRGYGTTLLTIDVILYIDAEDESPQHAALRETMEEIGISNIDILGQYAILPNKHRNLRVHPFVGYIKDPVDVSKIKYNPDEVARVFTLPLEYLTDPAICEMQNFRDSSYKYPVYKTPKDIEVREIWGLTSFIMSGKV